MAIAFPSRWTLLLASLALLAGCRGAYFHALNARAPDRSSDTFVYDQAQGLSLDLYRADRPMAPVVVFFYGGSWRNGRREEYRFVASALADSGALTLVPDYGKAPAHPFPDFMHDAAHAVAWARANAARHGGDPQRIFVVGHSAGAHIAALLAADARYLAEAGLAPADLAGVVGLSGPYDFLPITNAELREVFGDEGQWPATQPVNFVDGDEPPFLLMHGLKDRLVDPRNSERLARRLGARGVPAQLRELPDSGHVGMLIDFAKPGSPLLRNTLEWMRTQPASPR
ncbi:alpha/beta hydrolase [Arenimonas sp.]|uniref:alpha/beta hydrolase n=1 Tax=Arenimonas sp. TaxID=1872635 RepID=UPI0039E699D9